MKKRRILRGVSLLLVISLLVVGIPSFVSSADEISELKQSIEKKQNEINKAKNEKKKLQTGLTDVKNVVASLETSKKNLANYVSKLDVTLTEVQTKIVELNAMISEKETQIANTNAELEQAIQTEQKQYAAMKARIKMIYERGDTFYLELMLTATSFSDMINKADYIEKLTAYDNKMLAQYQATKEYVALCKEQLEAEQELLNEAKVDVEKEQKSLELLIAEKEKEITAYESDINNQEKLMKEYEDEIAAQNAEIKELEAAVAAEREALAQATARKYDGGIFAWPAPSYKRISDDYGYRTHPILKVKQFHNGIDMAAPGGSPILAAYDGKVISAAYSSTMGNYIMIDHGSNLYTIYMHASALHVSKGEEVKRGQRIASVGTTGRSTGNHLHFSVRLNGSYVNPWDYLKK